MHFYVSTFRERLNSKKHSIPIIVLQPASKGLRRYCFDRRVSVHGGRGQMSLPGSPPGPSGPVTGPVQSQVGGNRGYSSQDWSTP